MQYLLARLGPSKGRVRRCFYLLRKTGMMAADVHGYLPRGCPYCQVVGNRFPFLQGERFASTEDSLASLVMVLEYQIDVAMTA